MTASLQAQPELLTSIASRRLPSNCDETIWLAGYVSKRDTITAAFRPTEATHFDPPVPTHSLVIELDAQLLAAIEVHALACGTNPSALITLWIKPHLRDLCRIMHRFSHKGQRVVQCATYQARHTRRMSSVAIERHHALKYFIAVVPEAADSLAMALLTQSQLLELVEELRDMAAATPEPKVRDALTRMADRYLYDHCRPRSMSDHSVPGTQWHKAN